MDRVELANAALSLIGGDATYLEIGVAYGTTFRQIDARTKIAVDPAFLSRKMRVTSRISPAVAATPVRARQYAFSMTSEDFFARQQRLLRRYPVNVALIDGLHTAEQSYRDILNTVAVLDGRGLILVHDCNPISAASAVPTLDEYLSTRTGSGIWTWNGDVWKAIVRLRAIHTDLKVTVLDCDEGLGIISLGAPDGTLDLDEGTLASLTYADLERDRKSLLNLQPADAAVDLVRAAVAQDP